MLAAPVPEPADMEVAPDPYRPDPALDDALQVALESLGLTSFRPGQREAIETLLRERQLLLIAPTGGGKSLSFQLPALLLPGTTVVLSPLIALMADQVQALVARGVAATFLASTLPGHEISARLSALARGQYKLVYAAPERLGSPAFREILRKIQVPLLAIDEAHCISEWGHDFRPEYLQIGELVREHAQARVLACTATATPIVRDEILARLGLGAETPQLIQGFARPNLALQVREDDDRKSRERAVDTLLEQALGRAPRDRQHLRALVSGTAIVYAPTRKSAEQEQTRLVTQGWRCKAYHAGLDGQVRERVLDDFIGSKLDVVVATNAFGMGIDRSDVRAVVHLAPPSSLEAYYQEVGRAGRDGADAWGMMLIAPGDMPLRRRLIERGGTSGPDDSPPAPAVVEHKWNLFLELMRWAEGGSCRHDAILRYFGDDGEALGGCGRCDVCLDLARGTGPDPATVSLIVRKALSAVARVHRRFGLAAAASLLAGRVDARLERSGLVHTPTFGCLKEYDPAWLTRLLRRCVVAGWVDFSGDDKPIALLTEPGRRVMKGEAPARLLLPPLSLGRHASPGKSTPRPRGPAAPGELGEEVVLDAAALALFQRLRAHRMQLAGRDGVPPYVVASDRSLRDLALLRPSSREQLLLAHGIGPAKADKYGPELLAVIADHARGGAAGAAR